MGDTSKVFAHCFAKLARARSHINELTILTSKFLKESQHSVHYEVDIEKDVHVWFFSLNQEIPLDLAVICGDVLHNLRSALDQTVCQLAWKHSGSHRDTYFPVGRDRASFIEQLKLKTRKLPQDARDYISQLKPYLGGDNLLWALHDANRRDKHLHLNVIRTACSESDATFLKVSQGVALSVGPRCGQHLQWGRSRPSAEEISRMNAPCQHFVTPRGKSLLFATQGCSAKESLEFMTTTPGAHFETDFTPTLSIGLACITEFELMPVVDLLSLMEARTREIVENFARMSR